MVPARLAVMLAAAIVVVTLPSGSGTEVVTPEILPAGAGSGTPGWGFQGVPVCAFDGAYAEVSAYANAYGETTVFAEAGPTGLLTGKDYYANSWDSGGPFETSYAFANVHITNDIEPYSFTWAHYEVWVDFPDPPAPYKEYHYHFEDDCTLWDP